MNNQGIRYYEFGEFRLDIKRRILIQNGNQIQLTGKNFDLLFVMIQSGGRILEHEELLDKVWQGLFVEQANLKKSISNLRHILGEKPNESLYIKTIPRRGYSFVADVRELSDETEQAVYRETEIEIEEIIETETIDENYNILPAVRAESFLSKLKHFKIPIIACVLLLTLTAGFFVLKSIWAKPSLNYSIENVRARRLTNEGNLGNSAPISPDGNYLVYPVYQGGEGSLWLKQLQTGSLARLTPQMKVQYWGYDYSPDSNYVYYIINHTEEPSQSGLYRIPTLGGTPQKLTDRAGGGLGFASDGSRFVFTRVNDNGKLEIVTGKPDGSDLKTVYFVPENKFLWSVKWSPDNLNLLCAFRDRIDGKSFGYIAEISSENNPDKSVENIIIPHQENQIYINAAWLPDKSSLILSIREQNADICQIWQYFPSSGEKRRVTNDDNSYRFINLTRDGKSLVTVQESYQSETWIADNQTLDFEPLANMKNLSSLFWTKNNQLIYEIIEDSRNTISLANEDGIIKQPLTNGTDGIYLYPKLSQDGNFITFLSNRSGSSQIWKIGVDGKNATQLTNSESVGLHSKLLSDGQTLIFMMNHRSAGWFLYKQSDGKIVPLTQTDTSLWCISPDEKLLAVEIKDETTKKYKIFIKNLENGETLRTFEFDSVRQLSWTRDGKALAYISQNKDSDDLILQPIDGSSPKILTNIRGQRIGAFDWTFDGSKLAVIRSKFMTDAFLIKAQEN